MRTVAQKEPTFDVDSAFGKPIDFGHERYRVDHNTVADYAHHAGPEYAGRHQVKDIAFVSYFDSVPGIIAALVSNDHVDILGKDVDDLSFTFISPLCSQEQSAGH
jgi:hypothetical protein